MSVTAYSFCTPHFSAGIPLIRLRIHDSQRSSTPSYSNSHPLLLKLAATSLIIFNVTLYNFSPHFTTYVSMPRKLSIPTYKVYMLNFKLRG